MTATTHTIIGLPMSGKTTFLAALWHLIDAGEIETQLVLDKLVGNNRYLNDIADAWRRCEEVPRTALSGETSVAIHVHRPQTGTRFALNFPDLAGESFVRQVSARACRNEYVQRFDDEGGILLFVLADRPLLDGLTIVEVNQVAGEPVPEDGSQNWRPWDAHLIPEQVMLVELLQFLQRPPFRRVRRPLAVIISAWDVVPAPKPIPQRWLEREMPLLYQFLLANEASFQTRVFGVSAQGGRVTGPRRMDLLQKTPSERVECVSEGILLNDLTTPIIWLLGEN